MRTQLIIIVCLAVGLSVFLYTRPKVVIKNEAGATRDQTAQTETKKNGESHSPDLSAEQKQQLNELKQQLATQDDAAGIPTLEKIAELFVVANIADSAGYFYELVAQKQPTENNWLRAGDMYFQAYNLALQNQNVQSFAEKTQQCYKNVLAKKPNNLHAMTNLAMTYVASASPMEAIGMLRQVLEINPNYEPALMNMGVLSLQSNQYDKAAGRFRQVLRINPINYNAQLGLAYSLIELKEPVEAKELLESLQKKNLDPNLKLEVENTLQNLK